MLSADNQVVVIHDSTVDRTTNGRGRVRQMTLAQLKELDAGSWFDARFAGERIPTLQEVFDLIGGRILINIEIKSTSLRGDGLEERVSELIAKNNLDDRVLISSFNPFALWRVRRLNPRLRLGLLYADDLPRWLRDRWLAFLSRPDALHPRYTMVTPEHVVEAHRRGQHVNAWTVNEVEDVHRMIAAGVDGIITDRPDVVASLLAEQG
jgi:glycerophosphoryl diester phosphodiesterase